MPPVTGVIDTFKSMSPSSSHNLRSRFPVLSSVIDLIRHGKNHNHVRNDNSKQPRSSLNDPQHHPDSREQQHAQAQPDPITNSAPLKSPEVAEIIVNEEREARVKMPVYKGLENFKLLEKMGEYVYLFISSFVII